MCESDRTVGAVCGRTYPTGIQYPPIVWLQMFEYAKDLWMNKSAQNIIGSVMCCPGCFSMFKLEAIRDVVAEYSVPVGNMEDVFTKDNGEDRWMCTLMMLKGWKLRYCSTATNTTFCPEDMTEFMKQRRRWILSDYANAVLVIRQLRTLVSTNDAFSVLFVLYLLQLFLTKLLYPGITIVTLCYGLELATGAPLIIVAPVIVAIVLVYCLMLLSRVPSTIQLVITKMLIIIFGAGTVYISVIVFKDLAYGYYNGHFEHAEGLSVAIVFGSYIYGAVLYPWDAWILLTGPVYLFFIPFMYILLPLYAICNIVDQSWGTRDKLPNIKQNTQKEPESQQVETTCLTSLRASSLNLSDFNLDEFKFWEGLVFNVVGSSVTNGLSNEDRQRGLKLFRQKALMYFLSANLMCMVALLGFYAFPIHTFNSTSIFSIAMGVMLGLPPLIQISGSTVYRIGDILNRIGRWINTVT
ncbi:chitin synthase chs-2-like [Mytilus trossulus]|uniref:chitin synthase chs-2-like n=1 Tax=Mytilus trossulus TaxID=6551 RepID=UPI00300413D4